MATRREQWYSSFPRDRARPCVEALEARFAPAGLLGPLAENPPPESSVAEMAPALDSSQQSVAVVAQFVGPIYFATPGDPSSVPEDPSALPRPTAPGEVITREHFDEVFKGIGPDLIESTSSTGATKQYDYRRDDFITTPSFDLRRPLPADIASMLVFQPERPLANQAEVDEQYGPKGVGGSEEPTRFPVVAMRAAETPEPPLFQTRPIEARPVGRNNGEGDERDETVPDALPPRETPSGETRPELPSTAPEMTKATVGTSREAVASAAVFLLPGSARAMSKRYRRGEGVGMKYGDAPRARDRPRSPPGLSFAKARA